MLGLGVFIGIAKKAYTQFDSLFGALKARSTYYENDGKSRSDVSRISSADILDKATILLTPTATSDARVHSVKTYTGDELVTNGGFDSSASWGMQSSWSIASGSANYDGISSHYIEQSNVFSANTSYKITFTISNNTDGIISIRDGAASTFVPNTNYSNGTYTFYITSSTNTTLRIYGVSGSGSLSIDNVSVTEADADFDFDRASSATRINSSGLVQDMQSIIDPELVLNGNFEELGDDAVTNGTFDTDSGWTKGTGWSIANGVASSDGSQSSNSSLYQLSVLSQYKTYKFQFTLSNVTNGSVRLRNGIGDSETYISYKNIDGTYTAYAKVNASNTTLVVDADADFRGSIDNVSVQQVDPNDRWTVGATWSLGDGVANYEGGSNSAIIQNITLTSGNTYNIKFTVSNASGNASIWIGNSAGGVNYFGGTYAPYANGSYDLYFTMPSNQTTLAFYGSSSGPNFSIDNISVKDITFSTDVDLARINYDSNGENGHILLEPTSTNLLTYSEDLIQIFGGPDFTATYPYDISPDGTQSSTRLQLSNLGNSRFFYSTSGIVTSGQSYTFSCYYKGTSSQTVYIKALVTGGTDVIKEITLNGNWQREDITFTAGSSTGYVYIVDSREGGTASDFQVWGAQLEALSYATSYIPSLTGSTVTREVEKLTGSGNAGLIESRQGTFYVDIAALAPSTGAQISISLSGGSSNDRVLIYSGSGGGEWKAQFKKDSSSYVSISKSATISNQAKIAAAWASGRYVMFVDGVKATAYSTGSETESTTFDGGDLTSIQFSPNNGSGSNFFYGKCKALAVFNEALSDTELTNLTS